jgi:hypothetical protein
MILKYRVTCQTRDIQVAYIVVAAIRAVAPTVVAVVMRTLCSIPLDLSADSSVITPVVVALVATIRHQIE